MRMTQYPLGAACIVDASGKMTGLLTDGDVRRVLSKEGDILNLQVAACMTSSPVYTKPDVPLGDALKIMEDRSSQISVLPVVDEDTMQLLGLLRLHDAYQPGLS